MNADEVDIGNTPTERNDRDETTEAGIFITKPGLFLYKEGYVSTIKAFYTWAGKSQVRFQLWRPKSLNDTNTIYELIGQTIWKSAKFETTQSYSMDEAVDHLFVQPNDVIGWVIYINTQTVQPFDPSRLLSYWGQPYVIEKIVYLTVAFNIYNVHTHNTKYYLLLSLPSLFFDIYV